jgi:hypothetical protein
VGTAEIERNATTSTQRGNEGRLRRLVVVVEFVNFLTPESLFLY